MSEITELELKKRFALEMFKGTDNFQAALMLFPTDTNKALFTSQKWPLDPEVNTFYAEFKKGNDLDDTLPSKAALAQDIWKRMQKCFVPEDYAKLAKLYSEIQGFIQKPGTVVNTTVNNNKVMMVTDHGTDEDWEAKLEKQQRDLVKSNEFH